MPDEGRLNKQKVSFDTIKLKSNEQKLAEQTKAEGWGRSKTLKWEKKKKKKQKDKAGILMRDELYMQDCGKDQDQKRRDGLTNETQVIKPNRLEKDEDRKCRKVLYNLKQEITKYNPRLGQFQVLFNNNHIMMVTFTVK